MKFCSYFEQIADSPNFLRKLALEFCLRPKSLKLRHSSNWAANLFKIWQNSNASLSVAYLFFIIYLKSKVWIITRLENLSGVYVECYRFLIFVVSLFILINISSLVLSDSYMQHYQQIKIILAISPHGCYS